MTPLRSARFILFLRGKWVGDASRVTVTPTVLGLSSPCVIGVDVGHLRRGAAGTLRWPHAFRPPQIYFVDPSLP
ncbi:hypothetical protein AALP_AA5G129600 [Arabis alpina]|uniref:Uncharacterized protein n=1 Tax=Arabis alpina TaxID=50452 RepID=A0A087GWR7_ARAAL|nr:hypothetical protein AALP_AA5G129600 [Arabis alpina]